MPHSGLKRRSIVVSDLLAVAVILFVAVLVFEAAWRTALALLVFGPAAYAAIVAGWMATTHGASVPVVLLRAVTFGALVRVVWINLIALLVSALILFFGALAGRHTLQA